jgi:mRNA-degrading endonuclease RelE of RelBE toxin-antitoxin system
MKIKAYLRFRKAYQDLPENLQKKVDKQLRLLLRDFNHPSLQTKKIKGTKGIWEARVDHSHRFTFEIADETLFLRVVGNHDEVLKKP